MRHRAALIQKLGVGTRHAAMPSPSIGDREGAVRRRQSPAAEKRWLKATARTTTVPSTRPSIWVLSMPRTMMAVPLMTIWIRNRPRTVPRIEPTPPERLHPPTTAAVIA